MPTTRRAAAPRKTTAKRLRTVNVLPTEEAPQTRRPGVYLRRLEILALFLSFVLAVICIQTTQRAYAVSMSVKALKQELHDANIQRMHLRSELAQAHQPAPATRQGPQVLASVVSYRDGEEALLQAELIGPLLAYHDLLPGSALKAVLIERRNAASRDVNVRLFMEDGTEESYLWPSTHSVGGTWASDCVEDVADLEPKGPELCPEGYEKPENAE